MMNISHIFGLAFKEIKAVVSKTGTMKVTSETDIKQSILDRILMLANSYASRDQQHSSMPKENKRGTSLNFINQLSDKSSKNKITPKNIVQLSLHQVEAKAEAKVEAEVMIRSTAKNLSETISSIAQIYNPDKKVNPNKSKENKNTPVISLKSDNSFAIINAMLKLENAAIQLKDHKELQTLVLEVTKKLDSANIYCENGIEPEIKNKITEFYKVLEEKIYTLKNESFEEPNYEKAYFDPDTVVKELINNNVNKLKVYCKDKETFYQHVDSLIGFMFSVIMDKVKPQLFSSGKKNLHTPFHNELASLAKENFKKKVDDKVDYASEKWTPSSAGTSPVWSSLITDLKEMLYLRLYVNSPEKNFEFQKYTIEKLTETLDEIGKHKNLSKLTDIWTAMQTTGEKYEKLSKTADPSIKEPHLPNRIRARSL